MKDKIGRFWLFWWFRLSWKKREYSVGTNLIDPDYPVVSVVFPEGDMWGFDGWMDGPSRCYALLPTFGCYTKFRARDRTFEEIKGIIENELNRQRVALEWVTEQPDYPYTINPRP